MGSAALYHLARRGVAAVGIEQFQTGHALGSSHGFSRIFRDIYYDPLYVELAEAAIPLWQELDSLSRETLMRFTGLLYFARPGNEVIQKSIGVMEALKRPIEQLTAQQAAARFPPLHLPPDTAACFTPQAGLLNVGLCVLAHLERPEHGATIHQETGSTHRSLACSPVLHTSAAIPLRTAHHFAGPWAPQILRTCPSLRGTQRNSTSCRKTRSYKLEVPVFGDSTPKFYGFPDLVRA